MQSEKPKDSNESDKGRELRGRRAGVNGGKTKSEVNQEVLHGERRFVPIKPGKVNPNEKIKVRTKERSITEIIEKVSTWRKLYNGVMVTGPDGRQ